MIRPSLLPGHAIAEPLIEETVREFLRDAASPQCGFRFENVDLFQARASLTVGKIPAEHQRDGHRHRMSYGCDAFEILCARPVDWSAVAAQVNLAALGPDDHPTTIRVRETLSSNGIARRLRLAPEKDVQVAAETSAAVRRLWRQVDGGTTAMAIGIPTELAESLPKAGTEASFFATIEALAVGVELGTPGSATIDVRLALAPARGQAATLVTERFLLFCDAVAAKVAASTPQVADGKDQSPRRWSPRVVRSADGAEIVVVEASVSATVLSTLLQHL